LTPYRPAWLHIAYRLAGLYDIPMPKSTFMPQSGSMSLATALRYEPSLDTPSFSMDKSVEACYHVGVYLYIHQGLTHIQTDITVPLTQPAFWPGLAEWLVADGKLK
jgi:hypothetical protein